MNNSLFKFIYKWVHIILPASLLLIFSITKNFDSPYERVIASDVIGYYAYLPAIFIYQDLSFNFTQEISEKYYVDGRAGKYEFINYYKYKPVNKYWIGLSILWFPFFLLAHFLSLLFGLSDDGYNSIHQYSIAVANVFYLSLGIYYLKKVLNHFFENENITLITIFCLILGTNLYYYSTVEPGHSHIYSFVFVSCLIANFIQLKYLEKIGYKVFFFTIFLSTIIVLIRPLNVFIILFSLLLIFEFDEIKQLIVKFWTDKLKAISILLIPFIFLFVQMYLWYQQTNFWYVDSYAGEKFNLNAPHFFDFLISYKKGWLTYTPMCLLSIAGIYFFFKNKKIKILITYSILFSWIYLLSSWWIWTYGTSFGQRLMIDMLPLLGIFLAATINKFFNYNKVIILTILTPLVALNIFQTWQQKNGVLPSYFVNKHIYWQSFLNVNKNAFSLYSDDLVSTRKKIFCTIKESRIKKSTNTVTKGELTITKNMEFSPSFNEAIESNYLYGITKLIVECEINAKSLGTNAAFVFDIHRNSKNLYYQKIDIKDFLKSNHYQKMQFQIDMPKNLLYGDSIKLYLMQGNTKDEIKMRNFFLEYLRFRKDE